MSKTPRTDVNEVEITGYAMSPRHYVRSEIARQLETELADKGKQLAEARAEIERLKLVSQNQETVIAAQRRSAKAKNELIEQMREALELMLEGAMHDFHYVCQHRDNCLCWGGQKARIQAAIAAERGE